MAKKKYQNLRTSYVKEKHKKASKSGDAAKGSSYKQWVWYKYLTFLDDTLMTSETVSTITKETEEMHVCMSDYIDFK